MENIDVHIERWVNHMQFDKLSDIANNVSLHDVISANPEFLVPIFYLIISIAIYSIIIWHFYRFIAKRDCFRWSSESHQTIYSMIKYFILFPLCAFVFFTGFSMMILFLTKEFSLSIVLSTSFSIIVAIRLTSYYNEDLSKDVAKMLPFALLALVLVDPSYFHIEDILLKVEMLPLFFSQVLQYIILIVFVEWFLRICLSSKQWIVSKKGKPSLERRSAITT